MSELTDQQKIQQLSYALGLAIGALETINTTPYDFNKAGLENILRKLKGIAELPFMITLDPGAL